jgi:hypothetical protein
MAKRKSLIVTIVTTGTAVFAISFLVVLGNYWNLTTRRNSYKLVFVDESCNGINDGDWNIDTPQRNFWHKLLLVSHVSEIAKDSNRTMLILSCPSQNINPIEDPLPWCDILSTNNHIICKSLQSNQVNKHISQCLSRGRQDIQGLTMLGANYKQRRVYFCEDQLSGIDINRDNELDSKSTSKYGNIPFNFSSPKINEESTEILERIIPDFSLSAVNRVYISSTVPKKCPEQSVCIFGELTSKSQPFIRFHLYSSTGRLQAPDRVSSTSLNVAILYLLLHARWLHVNSINHPALDNVVLLVEDIRHRNGQTYCSSLIQSQSEGIMQNNRPSGYITWCRLLLHEYTTPQPFVGGYSQEVSWFVPQIGSRYVGNVPASKMTGSEIILKNSSVFSWWFYKYKLFELRFLTRPFFRYQIIGWTIFVVVTVGVFHYYILQSRKCLQNSINKL